jgi:hypothetical protein
MRFTLTLVDDTNDAITIVGDMDMMTFGAPTNSVAHSPPRASSPLTKTDPLLHWWATGTTVCA